MPPIVPLRCPPSSFLHEGQCLSSCPRGTFAEGAKCRRCHSACATCHDTSAAHCDSCASDPVSGNRMLLLGRQCVGACPQGFVETWVLLCRIGIAVGNVCLLLNKCHNIWKCYLLYYKKKKEGYHRFSLRLEYVFVFLNEAKQLNVLLFIW